MSKPRDSAAQWREIVHGQVESGLSIAAYCRRTQVPQSSFYAWRRKLLDSVTFAEVRVTPETGRARNRPHELISEPTKPSGATIDADAFEVRLTNGRCIVVRAGFDRRTLLDLMATLEAGA